MAGLESGGLDELMRSLEEIAETPDEVLEEMLQAQAAVVAAAQRKKLARLGLKHPTGQLERSISTGRKMKRDRSGAPALYVYPRGKRKKGEASNGEVGFILEYGAPGRGLPPKPWMRPANAEAEAEAAQAAQAVHDRWLEEKL